MKRSSAYIPKNTPYKKRRTALNSSAYVIKNQNAMVAASRRIGQSENKCTQVQTAQAIYNTGFIQNLYYNMSQGTAPLNQYLGNEVLPTSIRMHLSATMGPLAGVGDGTNICRCIIFQWLDASVPVPAGLLQSPTDPHSFILWNNTENVRILSDKLFAVKQYAGSSTSFDAVTEKVYIKGKKIMPTKFDQHGGGTTQKGGLYCLLLTDSSAAPAPYFNVHWQITYTDK